MNTVDRNNLDNFSKINSFSELQKPNGITQGEFIANLIDIAREYPDDHISKKAIIKLAELDSYIIENSTDPVGEYVSYFGVNCSWDKYGGKLHSKDI